MDRRAFMKLLSAGMVGHTLDIDKLLWVPGAKTIFLPSPRVMQLDIGKIVAAEFERILPRMQTLFDRDDKFYASIAHKHAEIVSDRPIRIPVDWKKK